jgi:thiamine kinase-like enzyme
LALKDWQKWSLPLTARPEVLSPLAGGLTNRSYRLAAPGLNGDLLLRINHPKPSILGIQRSREREITRKTAELGIGRPFLYWDPNEQYVVFPWLDARTWTDADFACPAQKRRLLEVIEQLKLIELPYPRRSYLSYVEQYWQQLQSAGLADSALSHRWQSIKARLSAFDRGQWATRLAHHDLIPSNVLETAEQIHVIDWEYAALGHPEIDLWSVEPAHISEPFIAELMHWINTLWALLAQAQSQ